MILDTLIASTRLLLKERKRRVPKQALAEKVASAPPSRDMLAALSTPGVAIIAEVKRASPSKGDLNPGLDPATLATTYARAGAAAISVLTEPTRFCGKLEDLSAVHQATADRVAPPPVLRKDFIIDSYQLYEARAWGADAVLLIAAALEQAELERLHAEALDLGLTPLVETHTEEELLRVKRIKPVLVGINNRDLRTFEVDVRSTLRLLSFVPPGALLVSESGIHRPAQVEKLRLAGVDAVLVGEALVTAPDPAQALAGLRDAAQ